MRDCTLPFRRGSTWSDGSVTMTEGLADHLEGRVYEVPDTEHGTGRIIKLRVVKNETGGDLTFNKKFVQFSHDADYEFGGVIKTQSPVAGSVCKPMDDAYTAGKTWPEHDLGYVVEEGWCDVLTENTLVNLAAGAAVATDGSGRINGAAAVAGEFNVGSIDQATTDENAEVTIWVNEGIAEPMD